MEISEKTKRILVLGAKGSLGGQLVKVFSSEGPEAAEVIGWDRGEVDITDRELILKKIADVKPDLLINAAAYNAVDKCEENDQEYELAKKINIDGPKFLAEACLKIGAVFVHYSTDYVFDGQNKSGYKENDEPKPANRYGKSKYHGEKRILELSGSGLKWYLVRTSKLFGPRGQSEISKTSFFDMMLNLSKNKEELEAVDEELSCFTYTPDLASATKSLVNSDSGYGIYHLVNSQPGTWYQAAHELFKITGSNVKLAPVSGAKFPRPAKRPKYSVLLNTKCPPLRDYRQALREYLTM